MVIYRNPKTRNRTPVVSSATPGVADGNSGKESWRHSEIALGDDLIKNLGVADIPCWVC